MSSQYECLKTADLYADAFGLEPSAQLLDKAVWPRKTGFFIRKAQTESVAVADDTAAAPAVDVPIVLAQGQFGLVPPWVKSASDAKLRATKLVNARSETVTTSTSFRDTWLKGQRCIIPMQAFLEDDWRSGKAVPTRIARVDGKPMGVAGLWEHWQKDGEEITSFTLLTINANSHELMRRYQQNGNEKRMPVILSEGTYAAWLNAPVAKAREFMRSFSAHLLLANPVQKK